MEVNRDLCVGMLIMGILGHYQKEDIINTKSIQYIAKTIKKKNFTFKHGESSDRKWVESDHRKKMLKAAKTQEAKMKVVSQYDKAYERLVEVQKDWFENSKIAIEAWEDAYRMSEKQEITASGYIVALLRKEPSVVKFYGLSEKKIKNFKESSSDDKTHGFRSSVAATKVLDLLGKNIATFNYRQSKEKAA